MNPMTDYSDEAIDFVNDYNKKAIKPRLDEHQDIIKSFGEDYERSYQMLNTFLAEAYRDQSYYLGNQWSLEELAYLNNQRRSSFTYNMCRRMINLVEGIQRTNRMSTIYTPIENSSNETADLLTQVGQYAMTYGGGYDKISTAFKDACVTGISWLSPYIDYRDDPISGDIKFHLDNWNSIMWDPFFYERDLSDCGFIARRKFLSRSEVISLIPDKEEEINALPYGSRDDKFTYMPFARQWGMQKLLNYTEYWKPKWVVKDVVVDRNTGETAEWKGSKERLRQIMRMEPSLAIIKKPVREVELGIIVEGELMYYGKDPYGINDYPFVPFWVCYEPSYDLYTWKLQGLIRFIRDPQTEINKRKSKLVDMLDAQLNSGWIAKTGAVTNTSSLYKTGNGQVLFVRPDANIDTDLRRIEAPDIPPGQMEMLNSFEKDIPNILGINPEMLGMPENGKIETAAVLAKARQSAGLVSLKNVFDSLAESQKILGNKVLQLIQKNYTPEKVGLITKKQVTDEFYSGVFARYDVVVEEGIETDTQRQMQFNQLLMLKQMGFNIPDSMIVESSNLVRKQELNEVLDQMAQQENEMMNQQQQAQQELLQMQAVSTEAKAHSDLALASERFNKINLDKALSEERIQRAEADQSAAQLNFIRSLKELESMDLSAMAAKIQMIKQLGDIQAADAAAKREEVEAQAQQQPQIQMPGASAISGI